MQPPSSVSACRAIVDPDLLEDRIEDASGIGPGHLDRLLRPESSESLSAWLADPANEGVALLAQGSRSSLTGGAVPYGGAVLDSSGWDFIDPPQRSGEAHTVRCGSGVRLDDLRRRLADVGLDYPPVPTYPQATVGGVISTNAAGPATFKYGQTRGWVQALELLLADGRRLYLQRGNPSIRPGGEWVLEGDRGCGILRVPHPGYVTPAMKKISAGYGGFDPLDPIDLFIGSEGTLGIVTAATLRVVPRARGILALLLFVPDADTAISAAAALRKIEDGPVASLRSTEFIDGAALDVLREDAPPEIGRIRIPAEAGSVLTLEIEWSTPLESMEDPTLQRYLDPLVDLAGFDETIVAMPGDEAGAEVIRSFRKAVPMAVNERARRRPVGSPKEKRAADPAVPPDMLSSFYAFCAESFRSRGVPFAVWGHLSDGNLHPNAMPRTPEEDRAAGEAIDALSLEAIRLGGTPLAEHGVGRQPGKQLWLRRLLGDDAIAGMMRVKRALDPQARLAPGVLWPEEL